MVETIMVVDDSYAFRERLARAFRERGFAVQTASNYDEAMDQARDQMPQKAVVDLRMPGKNGLELVRDLREMDDSVRAIALTAFGSIATAIDTVRLRATY